MPDRAETDPIVREIHIDASPETVFAFFTEPDKLTRWLAEEVTVEPRPGGINHLTQTGHPGTPGPYYMRGEFVEVEPPSRLVFTWGFTNPDIHVDPGASTVEVTLEPKAGGTLLRLVHRGLPPNELAPHEAGWTELLDRLAAVAAAGASPLPGVVDRAAWQAEIDALRVREKAHTHEGDAIAAARRRLPMVEIDAGITLTGRDGPVTLLEVFEGRRQLVAYFHMWFGGQPAEDQCEGCTFFNGQVRELSYLHSRDVTYATFCEGPYEESVRYRDFMGWDVPWYSAQDSADALLAGRRFANLSCYLRNGDRVFETYWTRGRGWEVMAPTHGLLDMTVYGRQEMWEDSPAGWPQRWEQRKRDVWRTNGRPTAQWARLQAGRSDDLGASGHP
jgi:predicted dithiol-disulfide oxidoreductase (DUF899 family)/uncharacterized protein YndB with AHSA1/START domain